MYRAEIVSVIQRTHWSPTTVRRFRLVDLVEEIGWNVKDI